jgi:DNA-binding NarL/FixJ family response regulator
MNSTGCSVVVTAQDEHGPRGVDSDPCVACRAAQVRVGVIEGREHPAGQPITDLHVGTVVAVRAGQALPPAARWRSVIVVMADSAAAAVADVRLARRADPAIPIAVYSESAVSGGDALRLVESGVLGFIDGAMGERALQRSLCALAFGEAAVPRHLVADLLQVLAERPQREQTASLGLTRREEQIVGMLEKGMSTKEMAECFYVSEVTIRTHLSAIYKKLGVHDRAGALSRIS